FRLDVVLDVVVAIGHGQATLIEVGNNLLGIVRVLRRTGGKKKGTVVGIPVVNQLQARDERRQFFRRLDLGNRIEFGLNGCAAAFFHGGFVHAGGVEVTNLLGDGIALLAGLGRLFEHAAEKGQVVLVELGVDRP